MKGLRKIIMVLMVLSMVVVFAAPASAATVSLVCTVTMAGYNSTTGLVEVRLWPDGKPGDKKFTVTNPDDQKLILAVALTALTSGMQVRANIDWQAGGDIEKMVILQPTQ